MMKTIMSALAVGMIAVVSAQAVTLEEIVANNIKARGGQAAIDAIKTLKFEGSVSVPAQGLELTITMMYKRPGKMKSVTTMQGMSMIQASDGKEGWGINPMMGPDAQKVPSEQFAELAEQAEFEGDIVSAQRRGLAMELVGTEDVEGETAYKVKITRKDGKATFTFIDAVTYLEMKTETEMDMGMGPMKIDNVMSDYRDVNGVKFPFSMTQMSGGQTYSIVTVTKAVANEMIADSEFAFPAPAKKK